MNLPNKLTILRTILIPFFLIFIYTDFWGKGNAYIPPGGQPGSP